MAWKTQTTTTRLVKTGDICIIEDLKLIDSQNFN